MNEMREELYIMKKLFLSFSSKDSIFADVIENELMKRLGSQIEITRYEKKVGIFQSFTEFMDSLGTHDFVLSIISDSYLKSDACLYEVGEVLKEHRFNEKMMFVVLKKEDIDLCGQHSIIEQSFAADIYTFEGRIGYLSYWQERDKEERIALGALDNIIGIKEKNRYVIRNKIREYDLPIFLDYIADVRGASLTEFIGNGFADIINRMFPNYLEDFERYEDIQQILVDFIYKISDVTGTEYNQIILKAKTAAHSEGLVVVADKILKNRQRYRIVINGGCISNSVDRNETIVVNNTENDGMYFCAVGDTKSEVVIPMIYNNRVVGAINSEAIACDYYTGDIVSNLIKIGNHLAALLVNKGYWIDAYFDELPYVSI